MKTISMVDLRTDSERIVRELRRGEHMLLSYRGQPIAEMRPVQASALKKEDPLAPLRKVWARTAEDPDYPAKAERYIQEVREARKAYGERFPE